LLDLIFSREKKRRRRKKPKKMASVVLKEIKGKDADRCVFENEANAEFVKFFFKDPDPEYSEERDRDFLREYFVGTLLNKKSNSNMIVKTVDGDYFPEQELYTALLVDGKDCKEKIDEAKLEKEMIPYIITEKIGDSDTFHTLSQHLTNKKDQPLTADQIRKVMFQLTWILTHLHSQFGIQHNDLHEGNIMVEEITEVKQLKFYIKDSQDMFELELVPGDLRIYLFDFGSAAIKTEPNYVNDDARPWTKPSVVALQFNVPPEQVFLHGDASERNSASDLFMLGHVMLTLLAHGRLENYNFSSNTLGIHVANITDDTITNANFSASKTFVSYLEKIKTIFNANHPLFQTVKDSNGMAGIIFARIMSIGNVFGSVKNLNYLQLPSLNMKADLQNVVKNQNVQAYVKFVSQTTIIPLAKIAKEDTYRLSFVRKLMDFDPQKRQYFGLPPLSGKTWNYGATAALFHPYFHAFYKGIAKSEPSPAFIIPSFKPALEVSQDVGLINVITGEEDTFVQEMKDKKIDAEARRDAIYAPVPVPVPDVNVTPAPTPTPAPAITPTPVIITPPASSLPAEDKGKEEEEEKDAPLIPKDKEESQEVKDNDAKDNDATKKSSTDVPDEENAMQKVPLPSKDNDNDKDDGSDSESPTPPSPSSQDETVDVVKSKNIPQEYEESVEVALRHLTGKTNDIKTVKSEASNIRTFIFSTMKKKFKRTEQNEFLKLNVVVEDVGKLKRATNDQFKYLGVPGNIEANATFLLIAVYALYKGDAKLVSDLKEKLYKQVDDKDEGPGYLKFAQENMPEFFASAKGQVKKPDTFKRTPSKGEQKVVVVDKEKPLKTTTTTTTLPVLKKDMARKIDIALTNFSASLAAVENSRFKSDTLNELSQQLVIVSTFFDSIQDDEFKNDISTNFADYGVFEKTESGDITKQLRHAFVNAETFVVFGTQDDATYLFPVKSGVTQQYPKESYQILRSILKQVVSVMLIGKLLMKRLKNNAVNIAEEKERLDTIFLNAKSKKLYDITSALQVDISTLLITDDRIEGKKEKVSKEKVSTKKNPEKGKTKKKAKAPEPEPVRRSDRFRKAKSQLEFNGTEPFYQHYITSDMQYDLEALNDEIVPIVRNIFDENMNLVKDNEVAFSLARMMRLHPNMTRFTTDSAQVDEHTTFIGSSFDAQTQFLDAVHHTAQYVGSQCEIATNAQEALHSMEKFFSLEA
jgi:hypothetical protein